MTKLEYLRRQKGLTQREFAEKLHISQSIISQIERGFRKPYPKFMELVSKVLEVPQSELFTENGECKFVEMELEGEIIKATDMLVRLIKGEDKMKTTVTFAVTFKNLAEIIDSLKKDSIMRLDIGDVKKLTVNDLISYLQSYADEVTYFNVDIDKSVLPYILEAIGRDEEDDTF
ncbi:helix-turn-helix domain-containing protein [Thermoanaerobacter sp. YS13]|uniref:helix-turn-helix domain-containing protein n=1 Tax=Thermoanaerobacter sp. YS13 TaxID=1511746 RepID=UPI00068B9C75|nr:helix-turn-helix transcriptional regulator [Thermoanaerobacter sp. YS13]